MNIPVSEILKNLSQKTPSTLYIVGGYVRNYLAENYISRDIDLAGNISAEEFISRAENLGFTVLSSIKKIGSVKIAHGNLRCEYSRFRVDRYKTGGKHFPFMVEFTGDISADAERRDFKCNAVYYDIKAEKIVDPLCGINDIKNKVLDTVKTPEEVFRSDGIRLLRLARFSAELGFKPTLRTIAGARLFAENIKDVSAKRIAEEMKMIKNSADKYPFSPANGYNIGLSVLKSIGVDDLLDFC